MKIDQISVFIENRAGRLAAITTALGDEGINIRAMSLEDNSDFGILRLIVDDTTKARGLLKERGFAVRLSDVIAVEIPDRPGELGKLLRAVEEAGLNVDYMYAFVQKNMDLAVMILRFDDLERGIGTLRLNQYNLLTSEQVAGL